LTLREGELERRRNVKDCSLEDLRAQIRSLNRAAREGQSTIESLIQRMAADQLPVACRSTGI
jgi:hypothetical protein